jgi:hypothetical protein
MPGVGIPPFFGAKRSFALLSGWLAIYFLAAFDPVCGQGKSSHCESGNFVEPLQKAKLSFARKKGRSQRLRPAVRVLARPQE